MLRLALIVLAAYFVSQVDAAQGQPSMNADDRMPAAHFILMRIGISSAKTLTEYHYLVDLEKRETGPETVVEIPANETTESHRIIAQMMRHNEEAYKRIAELFRNEQNSSSRSLDLSEALYWIERRSAAGYSRAYSIVASPDGTHVVHTANGEPLLLIDVKSLRTQRLIDNSGTPRTPVAWSPDSRFVAYAPPRTGKVYVYDLMEHKIVSEKSGEWQWAEALSWSPDGQQIAAFGTQNRSINKSILGRLAASVGHPEYRNDWVLHVYRIADDQNFSVVLKHQISEWGSPDPLINWK